MKKVISLMLVFFFGYWFYISASEKSKGLTIEFPQPLFPDTLQDDYYSDSISGDFDGDGKQEYVWLESPDMERDSVRIAKEGIAVYARFSDKKFQFIKFPNHYSGGILMNEGDLDDNGTDELSVIPFGEGSWAYCCLYTWRYEKWHKPIKCFDVWDGLGDRNIYKDSINRGYVIVNEWYYDEEKGIQLETMSVKFNY